MKETNHINEISLIQEMTKELISKADYGADYNDAINGWRYIIKEKQDNLWLKYHALREIIDGTDEGPSN